nr:MULTISPECIES: hypothetical protein [Kribbella]
MADVHHGVLRESRARDPPQNLVTDTDSSHAVTHGLHHAGQLVAQLLRKLRGKERRHLTAAEVVVERLDTRSLDADQHLPRKPMS